jgi:hypothetical protein
MSCCSIRRPSNSNPCLPSSKKGYIIIENLLYTSAASFTSFGAESFASAYKLTTVATAFFSAFAVGVSSLIVNTGYLVGKPATHYFRNTDSEPFTKLCIDSFKDGRLELLQSFFPNFLSTLASSFVSSLSDANDTLSGNETSSNYTTLSVDGNLTATEIDPKDGGILLGTLLTTAFVTLFANQFIRACISLQNKCSNDQSVTTVCTFPSTQGLSSINLNSDLSKIFLGLAPEAVYGVASLTQSVYLAFLGLLILNIAMSGIEISVNANNALKLKDKITKAKEYCNNNSQINWNEEDIENLSAIHLESQNPDQNVESLKELYEKILELFKKNNINYPPRAPARNQILPHPVDQLRLIAPTVVNVQSSNNNPTTNSDQESQDSLSAIDQNSPRSDGTVE